MSADARPLSILLVEDNPGDARLIREMLAEVDPAAYRVERAERLDEGADRLAAGGIDVVLLDLSLPDSQGLETFAAVQARAPSVPVVVLSGTDDEALAVRAVQQGAQDYLVKGQVSGPLLARALRYAVERKRIEQERKALERQKDQFLANISHDLRTPLAAIKLSIGVVLANKPPDTPAPLHRMLNNINLAADQMARLVEDLLELTRLQARRAQLNLAACDLRTVAERAARSIAPLAEVRGQQVELSLPQEPLTTAADAARLERVLLNLLNNAHVHGRADGRIRFGLERRSGEAIFEVADDGPGIPEPEQGRIFERFYRSEAESGRRPPGSGLGLPIARALVELHGGRLWVVSQPGHGATFWATLPLTSQNGQPAAGPRQAAAGDEVEEERTDAYEDSRR